MRTSLSLALLILMAPGLAQGQSLKPTGPLRAERATRGDTVVVRTVSGSTWGDRVRLVEELRIGSLDDGPDAFGAIHSFALLRDGGVAVFDGSVPALRLFGSDGRYRRTLGREGAGPGEYRNQALGLVVDPDGNLVMYDPRNARLNRWTVDGTALPSWGIPGSARLSTAQALQVDTTGTLMVKVLRGHPQPGQGLNVGLARFDRKGEIVDTLPPPPIEGPPVVGSGSFVPQRLWSTLRAGGMVSGYSGGYALTVHRRGQRPIRIERATPRVALRPGERADYQARADAQRQPSGGAAPARVMSAPPVPVPAEKPYYRGVQSDLDGRIWVQLSMPSESYRPPPTAANLPPLPWREPSVWDVFQADGTYLGQVSFPWLTTFQEARGQQIWAIQRGADDEQYVVRYRLVID